MQKFFKTLLVALLLIPSCAWANGWNNAEYQRIEQSIQLPGIKQAAKKYAISAYGAKQNVSAAQNQKAINKLIALVSKKGGGTVVIPKDTWRTGAIEMKSFVDLHLEEGAVLQFAFEPKLYPLMRGHRMLELFSMHLCLQGYRHRHNW